MTGIRSAYFWQWRLICSNLSWKIFDGFVTPGFRIISSPVQCDPDQIYRWGRECSRGQCRLPGWSRLVYKCFLAIWTTVSRTLPVLRLWQPEQEKYFISQKYLKCHTNLPAIWYGHWYVLAVPLCLMNDSADSRLDHIRHTLQLCKMIKHHIFGISPTSENFVNRITV